MPMTIGMAVTIGFRQCQQRRCRRPLRRTLSLSSSSIHSSRSHSSRSHSSRRVSTWIAGITCRPRRHPRRLCLRGVDGRRHLRQGIHAGHPTVDRRERVHQPAERQRRRGCRAVRAAIRGRGPDADGGNSPAQASSGDIPALRVRPIRCSPPRDAVDEARKGTVLPESGAVVGESIYYSHEHIVLCGGRGSIAQAPGPGSDISHRAIWGHSEFIRPQPPSVDADPPSRPCRGASRRGLRPRGGSCTSLRDAHRPPRVGVSPATSRHTPHHGQSARVTASAAKHANTAAEPRNPTELKPPRAP